MGYGEKVKKWFFDEDGDGEDIAEDYDAVEVDTEPKTSLFEQAKFSKTSEAVKSLNMNKDSHLVLFEPRSFGETQDIANYLKTKKYRKIRKQNPNFKETTEEFLSGWHPDDRLVPVITVTIYFGNDGWDAAKSLQEMFSETDESLKEFLPDYKLHLISCNNISDFTKFHTEFGRLMHILKVISDEEQMDILLSDPGYSALSVTAAQIINTFTGLHFSIPEKEDTINMRNAWTDHKESGRREGFNEATTSYTQRMYKAGIPLEVIAEVIEKPVTEVEKILSNDLIH